MVRAILPRSQPRCGVAQSGWIVGGATNSASPSKASGPASRKIRQIARLVPLRFACAADAAEEYFDLGHLILLSRSRLWVLKE